LIGFFLPVLWLRINIVKISQKRYSAADMNFLQPLSA